MFETRRVDWDHVFESDTYVNTRRPVYSHHPSGAYNRCIRETWYKMVGAPMTNPPEPKAKRIFGTGHSTEDRIQDLLKKKIDVIDANHKIQTHPKPLQLPICGEIDLIMNDDGQPVPVEIKTANSRNFHDGNYMRAPAKDRPYEKHCWQVTPYMKVLEAPYAYVVYECKDDHEMAVHQVKWSDEAWTKILDKFSEIEEYVLSGTEPERLPEAEIALYKISSKKGQVRQVKPFECRYCDFQTGCFSKEIIEADAEPDKIRKAKEFREKLKQAVEEYA